MLSDRKGDMGFMEAAVSMIAVSIVLSMYLAFVVTSTAVAYDPMDGFDADSLDVSIEGGVTISESYALMFIGSNNIRGLTVEVSVPGFEEGPAVFVVGSDEGLAYSRQYVRTMDYDNGRTVMVLIGVTALA